MTRSHSLTAQAVAAVVAAQLLCAVLLAGAALAHERRVHLRTFDVLLQGRSDSLLGAIQDADDAGDSVTLDSAELKLPRDDVYAVYNRGGQLVGRSPGAPDELVGRRQDGFRDVRLGHGRYRVLEREALRVIDRAETHGVGRKRPVTIVYASSEARLWHSIFEAVRFYLVAIALATAAMVLCVVVLLRRALRPLGELASATKALEPPHLHFDPPASVLRVRELRPLAEVLADSVRRVREAFSKEQQFLGDAAHELKTAVAVTRSSVQLLMLRPRTSAEYHEGLGRVLDDNRRAERLIAQMLTLSSAQHSAERSRTLPMGTVELRELVAEVARDLAPVAAEAGVGVLVEDVAVLRVRLAPQDGVVVVSNLLLNAVQHSRAGQVVRLSASRVQPGEVEFRVEDKGDGIAPDALPHVFERFFREDRSRSRATGGTGLGLSIVQSMVAAAGGRIVLHSEPGKGTSVFITFIAA